MFDQAKAVSFVQVADAERARAFYGGVLGLPLRDDGFALVADFPGGAMLRITTLPGWTAAEHPVFGFGVADAGRAAAALADQGVPLIRYAFLGEAQRADGVWTGPDGTRVGWFKDPDGNLLSFTADAG